ncbi:GNAT family N-acetyltransferase [Pseudomonas sp. RP23018S]|uniref:GNAT family N-acetyltransferase n=1 Tax=Pseudomonas sp. RP23018S TaxID=3096037 RepID=UPI002ACA306D|nr:GNAT family N-acetyltransferase [Pseudomonas sp. RP23018S]MDZ5602104.1 GNAT family N-acetyltransferase [Pseudomonas sp. RP23018S]
MPDYHCHALPAAQRRLLQLFYRQYHSRMKPSGEAALWVARRDAIIGGMCLTPIDQGHWLTSLFVAPAERGQGVAAALIEAALASVHGPVWLFCEPALAEFYEQLGFSMAAALPQALGSRLQRYQRSKALVALQRDPR